MPAPLGHPNYATEHKGGRPTKYTAEFIEGEAEALENWMKLDTSIYFKRFAFDRGYSQQRLDEFAKVSERFSEVLEKAREWQEIRLAEGGLRNEFNGNFCKFVMANTCGWTEKVDSKISGDATHPLAFLMQKADGETKDLVNE